MRTLLLAFFMLFVLAGCHTELEELISDAPPAAPPVDATIDLAALRVSLAATGATSLGAGDLDADGLPDLVATHSNPDQVSLHPGLGGGHFRQGDILSAGATPTALVIEDLDGDGDLDLAVLNQGSRDVHVFLGDGTGNFDRLGPFPAGAGQSLVTGDFNNDGRPDLAADSFIAEVVVLLGQGDGTFGAPTSFAAVDFVTQVVTGDFNGDGETDLAAGSDLSRLAVLPGRGDGTFGAPLPLATGVSARRVAAADFDGDARLDLAVADRNAGSGELYLGNGDGSFQPPRALDLVGVSLALAAGDLTGDGRTDLISANTDPTSGRLVVLEGRGDGTFEPARTVLVGSGARGAVLADLDGNGVPDLATANHRDGRLVAVLDRGQTQAPRYGPMEGAAGVISADFDADGAPDLAVAESGSTNVSILLNQGDGTFPAPLKQDAAGPQFALAAADLDQDGELDLVTPLFGPPPSTLTALLGRGDGTFESFLGGEIGGGAASVAAADFDRDGFPDALVVNGAQGDLTLLLGNGDGTFRDGGDLAAGQQPNQVVAADFDGDANPDFAVSDGDGDTAVVRLGRGDGSFDPEAAFPTGASPLSIATGDLDQDGALDLIVGHRAGLTLLPGRGDGTFDPGRALPGPSALSIALFGNHGLATASGSEVWIFPSLEESPLGFGAGLAPSNLAVEDLNGDGRLDVAASNAQGRDVSVLLSRGQN